MTETPRRGVRGPQTATWGCEQRDVRTAGVARRVAVRLGRRTPALVLVHSSPWFLRDEMWFPWRAVSLREAEPGNELRMSS